MNPTLKQALKRIEEEHLDGFIVSLPANISYLAGFESRDSYALISPKESIYFTDSRYTEEVKHCLKGFSLKKIDTSVFKLIADGCNSLSLERVGFEERVMTVAEHTKIRKWLLKSVKLLPTHGIIERLRAVKSEEEIALIRKAAQITIKSFNFIEKFIAPGLTEIEIAGEIERFVRQEGASGTSFEVIVACGPNTSYPHHLTSSRKVKKGEPVLIDMGVAYKGYKSDLTRVFFSGRIDGLYRDIYQIVKTAQAKAIEAIQAGVKAACIDTAARQHITQQGYGSFFGHNGGHGVGREVHEAPSIAATSEETISPGMVFTIEPGIYLPDRFGVRIEDMVLVHKKGVEVISGTLNK